MLHISTLNRRGFIKAAGGAAAATLVAGRLPARAAAAPVPLGTG